MKIKSGDYIHAFLYLKDGKKDYTYAEVVGFYCYGMHLKRHGVWPFVNYLNWYAFGYDRDGSQAIYLLHSWKLSRAIIFELVRRERHGRIFFWHKNDQKHQINHSEIQSTLHQKGL